MQVQKGPKKPAQKPSRQDKYVYQTLQSNGEHSDPGMNQGIPLVDPLTNQSSVSKTFPRIKAIQGQRRPSLSRFTSNFQPPAEDENENGAEIKPPYSVVPTQGEAPFSVPLSQQGGTPYSQQEPPFSVAPSQVAPPYNIATSQEGPPYNVTTAQQPAPFSVAPSQSEMARERFSHAAQVHKKSFDNESRDFSEMEYDSGTLERQSKGRRRRRKKKSSTASNAYDQLK